MNGRIALGGLVVLGLLVTGTGRADEDETKGVADSEIGLRGVGVFEVAVPPPVRENSTDPGEASLPLRINDELPPVVPHGMADFLPITRSSNACVDCHEVEEKEPGEPTPLPPSHFRDLRNAPDEVGETLAGARWVCVSCHVAPTAAEPLVGNAFYDAEPSAERREDAEPEEAKDED